MTPPRSWTGPALLAAALAFSATPAAGQPAGFEALGGIWHENDWVSIEIGPEVVTTITPDSRWVMDAASCPNAFEHQFQARTRADFMEFFGLDSGDPYAGLIDEDGASINDQVLAAWPAGDGTVNTLWSYCAAELHGGSLYFLDDSGGLTAVRYGDGIAKLVTFSRDVPPPSHDSLSFYQRQEVQTALQQRGLYDGAIDGIFGPGTEAAIMAYQKSIDEEATGILTRQQMDGLLYGP